MQFTTDLHKCDPLLPYENAKQHLDDERKLLCLMLMKIFLQKSAQEEMQDERSVFVSQSEVELILNSLWQSEFAFVPKEVKAIEQPIGEFRQRIDKKISKTTTSITLPLVRLMQIFDLTLFERQVLLLAQMPEVESRYERIFAYFNDDLTKKCPSIELALDLFSNVGDRAHNRQFFCKNAPLLRFQLIQLIGNEEEGSFVRRRFKVDSRIREFISGCDRPDGELVGLVRLRLSFAEKISDEPSEIELALHQLLSGRKQGVQKHAFWLYGNDVGDSENQLRAICGKWGLRLLIADLQDIFACADSEVKLRRLFREAILQPAILSFSGGEILYREEGNQEREFTRVLSELSWITFVSAGKFWFSDGLDECVCWHPLQMTLPKYEHRREMWIKALGEGIVVEEKLDKLSSRFHFGEKQIANAISYAKEISANGALDLDDLYRVCTMHSIPRLSTYVRKIDIHYVWDDIVLPQNKTKHLREICNSIKYKYLVFSRWGFSEKFALGKGVNILFSGPSGTGKTMAAEIIAGELEMSLYKADLSSMTSKYIGETEKNLDRVFREICTGNSILFFDEADALFGKRGEVKEARDRYANIVVNYLLQKIEEHEGVVVLATNLAKNMDEAFARRMHFALDFAYLNAEYREMLWRKIFPKKAPMGEIDYKFLAQKLNLAGGSIKNIALAAAFCAAEDKKNIEMTHLVYAAKREYEKIGKTFIEADFMPYSKYGIS